MKSPVMENIHGPLEVIAVVCPLWPAGQKPHFISSNPYTYIENLGLGKPVRDKLTPVIGKQIVGVMVQEGRLRRLP